MKNYKAIILDLDGTLLNTLEDLANSVNFALSKHNMPTRTLSEVKAFVGNGVRNLMIRAVPGGEENPVFEETFDTFKEHYGVHCNDKTAPYEGIMELLQTLKERGYLLGIVSNKLDSAVKALSDIYFKGLVDVAVGEKEGVERKPAPDTVNEVLRELQITSDEAIYVGDSDVDIQTARNANMPCISVLWGFRDREFLEEHGAMLFARIPEDIFRFL